MTKFKNWQPQGVIPAVLLPFKSDFSIDAAAYRQHLRDVGGIAGVTALTVNGHSCEVHALNLDEQRETTAALKRRASPARLKPMAPRRC